MNRRGLWAGGVALILLVVGAAALTTVGAGYRPRHKVCDTCVYLAWQKE